MYMFPIVADKSAYCDSPYIISPQNSRATWLEIRDFFFFFFSAFLQRAEFFNLALAYVESVSAGFSAVFVFV